MSSCQPNMVDNTPFPYSFCDFVTCIRMTRAHMGNTRHSRTVVNKDFYMFVSNNCLKRLQLQGIKNSK